MEPVTRATDTERDLRSLLASCPCPRSEDEWAWETAFVSDMQAAYELSRQREAARERERLAWDAPWLRFEEDTE